MAFLVGLVQPLPPSATFPAPSFPQKKKKNYPPLTIQTRRRHPDAIIAVQQRDLIFDRPHQHLRRQLVRTRLVESHNNRENGGGGRVRFGGSGGVISFGREGDWVRIEDLDEEVAMFDADHGFLVGWLVEVGRGVEDWMDGGVSLDGGEEGARGVSH